MRKNIADRVKFIIFQIFYRKKPKNAIMGLNWANLGQNTRYFDFPVELSAISEISIWEKSFFRECGYFGIYGIFVRPLDKIVHNRYTTFYFRINFCHGKA